MGNRRFKLALVLLMLTGCSEAERDYEKLMHGSWDCESKISSQELIISVVGGTTMDEKTKSFTTDILISTDHESGENIAQVQINSSGKYQSNGLETTYTFVESKSKLLSGNIDPMILEKMDQEKIENPGTVVTTKITDELWVSHSKEDSKAKVICKKNI